MRKERVQISFQYGSYRGGLALKGLALDGTVPWELCQKSYEFSLYFIHPLVSSSIGGMLFDSKPPPSPSLTNQSRNSRLMEFTKFADKPRAFDEADSPWRKKAFKCASFGSVCTKITPLAQVRRVKRYIHKNPCNTVSKQLSGFSRFWDVLGLEIEWIVKSSVNMIGISLHGGNIASKEFGLFEISIQC